MTKMVNNPIVLQKTNLMVINNYMYIKKFNAVLPMSVISVNDGLGTMLLSFFGNKSILVGIFMLSVVWYTKKLKFKHKLSWFFFKRKSFKMFIYQIGKSHYVFQTLAMYILRSKSYTSPNSLIFFGVNWRFLNVYSMKTKQIQTMNPYTLSGLSFGRQEMYKRQGKVSKYSGLKSKIF